MSPPPDDVIRSTLLGLLARRRPGASICPSEAARELSPEDWRSLMPAVVDVARKLARGGLLEITQRGGVRSPDAELVGPIRLRLVRSVGVVGSID